MNCLFSAWPPTLCMVEGNVMDPWDQQLLHVKELLVDLAMEAGGTWGRPAAREAYQAGPSRQGRCQRQQRGKISPR